LGLPAVGNAEGLGIGAEAAERQGGALEFIPGLEERKMQKNRKSKGVNEMKGKRNEKREMSYEGIGLEGRMDVLFLHRRWYWNLR
jgi:hypothetical protein